MLDPRNRTAVAESQQVGGRLHEILGAGPEREPALLDRSVAGHATLPRGDVEALAESLAQALARLIGRER